VTTAEPQRKKLIEVALPLDEINAACKADKDRKTGTLRNLHKWFAPMPLPAWRALLFAALVDDPEDDERRAYYLDVVKRLMANGANLPDEETLGEAHLLLRKQYPDGLPVVFDPFCGGGSALVEAQRLGLDSYGSDLNPVPVLISRTLTELLPKVHGQQPLHAENLESKRPGKRRADSDDYFSLIPAGDASKRIYAGYEGLARDVSHYADKIHAKLSGSLASHYPVRPGENPLAWLWARTAECPNPACGAETLLVSSMSLSKRKHQYAWIEPHAIGKSVELRVRSGERSDLTPPSPKIGDGIFACLRCGDTLDGDYLRTQGKSGRLGVRMTAVAYEANGERRFRAPDATDLAAATDIAPSSDFMHVPINVGGQGIRVGLYGIDTWDRLYTPRQLQMLTTAADLVAETYEELRRDGASADWATAVATLLGLGVGRLAQYQSSQVRWFIDSRSGGGQPLPAFARHDMPMQWDFVEPAPTSSAGSLPGAVRSMTAALSQVAIGTGAVVRADARVTASPAPALIATDPPYFDAIGYADLSDYFYLWHRRALRQVHPDLYGTVAAPKTGELTAVPSHHGNSKEAARKYFIHGFTETFQNLQRSLGTGLPMLVVYASKEQKASAQEETRWSSILTAMIDGNLEITGTWPIRGTGSNRMVGLGTNAVATYVVMVCRPRPESAGTCSLGDFNRALRRELKPAVHDLQAAGILPVDLAQAAMGPGMQVYSRYREVLDQGGQRVSVEQALRLINAALGEVLDEQEGELDPDSRFAVAWWEKHGWSDAKFGEADQLARPQGISVDDLVRAGVARYSKPGFVAVLGAGELDRDWSPSRDRRPTAWEAVHHLADRLIDGGGAVEAARLMAGLGTLRDPAQALVYRLNLVAAKKGRGKDQERYNALIGSWSDLLAMSATEEDGLF